MQFLATFVVIFLLSQTANCLNCSCVGFRLDDIQDFYLKEGQLAVMDVFRELNIPLTIGVIGNFIGNDLDLIDNITGRLATAGSIEIASHGWNHEDFTNFTLSEQESLLGNSSSKIQSLFGVKPDVFLAPYDAWNADTITALTSLNFHTMSSEVDLDPAPWDLTAPIVHIPAGAATADWKNSDADLTVLPVSHMTTLQAIETQYTRYGFAAVLMHPMEFHDATVVNGTITYGGVNQTQINELRLLLQALLAEGLRPTSIGAVRQAIAPIALTTGVPATTGMPATTGSPAENKKNQTQTTNVPPPQMTTGEFVKPTTGATKPVEKGTTGSAIPATSAAQSTTGMQHAPVTTGVTKTKGQTQTQSTRSTAPTQSSPATSGAEPTKPVINNEETALTAFGTQNVPALSFSIVAILLSRFLQSLF
jgi:peptidoglycan/xylan/chitin deacetylase (PgdA/CDA1 family)